MPLLDANDPAAIAEAARRLAAGELVAFPTETVYGLGARADADAAVARIYAAKRRPAGHPLIVHVADLAAAAAFAAALPPPALRLAAAYWPGPLTLIVPRAPGRASAAAAGQASIALRCPAHPAALALLAAAAARGVPGVAAPSANRHGRVSPTTAAHVQAEFGDALCVLDGGPCALGIESAIVDLTRGAPMLLRPGVLTRAQIEAAAGAPLAGADAPDAPRASGTLASHYAPRARVRLHADAAALAAALAARPAALRVAVYCRTPLATSGAALQRRMPDDATGAARELYAALRELDADGVAEIWVEQPPDHPEWEGVRDRLRRAAH
jgi:L-threonylcarbamoyladenylate synthase